MRNTENKKTLAPSIQKNLDKLSNYLKTKLKKEPSAEQKQFMAMRLWQVDHENHFSQLTADIVSVILYVGRHMATTDSAKERQLQYSYLVMLHSLFSLFNDLESNECSIVQK